MQGLYDEYGRQVEALEARRAEVVRAWRGHTPSERECKRFEVLGDMLAEVEWARRQMLKYTRR